MAERKAYDRAQERNEEVFRRVGWRQLVVTLLEKGWFARPDCSAIEAVYRSRFEDAVRLISIENAGR